MSKLASFSSKQLVQFLKKLGFKLDHTTGSHFIFYHPESKKRAVVPYSFKDLPKGTLMSILKEAGITREDIKNAGRKS